MIGWLQNILGFHQGDSNSPAYLFFSGPCIVIAVIWHGFFSGWSRYRTLNCHVARCPWIGVKTTAAGDHVCWKHYPHNAPTAQQVTDDHVAAISAAVAHDD